MAEVLLSISEAAKLMDVCENTLREWDDNGKFVALRTEGGHRRYDLETIRQWLDNKKSEPEPITELATPYKSEAQRIFQKWKDSHYLQNCETQADRINLAILLENASGWHEHQSSSFIRSQFLQIVADGWNNSKLKKIVSVQPLLGPAGLAYYNDSHANQVKIVSEAVVAQTFQYGFAIYPDSHNLQGINEVYASMIGTEIDLFICDKMHSRYPINIEDMTDLLLQDEQALKPKDCSYVATSCVGIRDLSHLACFKDGIDLIQIPTQLDPDSFAPISLCGKYPENNRVKPIFCPYMLFTEFATQTNGTRTCGLRAGWLD